MRIKHSILIIAVLISFYSLAVALPSGITTAPKVSKISEQDTEAMIDVNNLQMFVTNRGGFAEDWQTLLGRADGLYFPAGSERHVLYSAGIWIGGLVNDTIRLAVGAFDTPEYTQGPYDEANDSAYIDRPEFKVYKIMRDSSRWTNPDQAVSLETNDGTPFARVDSASHWNDYTDWANYVEVGAPPLDSNGAPLVRGDQTLWAVYNDMNVDYNEDSTELIHTYDSYGGGTLPLGIEMKSTYWGYDLSGALGNTIFVEWIIYNRGDNQIDSTYVSLWADPDLGGASDDLVGCDTATSLGYCYNATNNDNTYGSNPPAVGFDFLQGPIIRESDSDPIYAAYDFSDDTVFLNTGEIIPQAVKLGMSSFNKYINGTDPDVPGQAYAYMKGLDGGASGYPDLEDPNGVVTKYFGAGDPVRNTGWVDNNPADRRYMLSTGPFTFMPGDSQIVVASIVVGQAGDRLSSVTAMKFYDILGQFAYDVNFEIPLPPQRPVVDVTTLDRKIVLSWNDDSERLYDEEFHVFEGYNVYQGESQVGPWTQIGSFDYKNGFGTLKDFNLNADLGDVIYQPVIKGLDEGIDYQFEIENDYINGGSLHSGRTYYYAVTAYSYDFGDWAEYEADPLRADSLFNVPKGMWALENRQSAISITPQDDPVGTDWTTATAPVTYVRDDTTLAPTTTTVSANIVNPDLVNGHTYEVVFRDIYPDTAVVVNADGEDITYIVEAVDSIIQVNPTDTSDKTIIYQYWELWDMTTGDQKLAFQTNQSGDGDYKVVDGIQFVVSGAHVNAFQDATFINNNTAHDRGLSWVDWGGGYFGGAVDLGINFWGGYLDADAMPDSFSTYEIRFVDDISQSGNDLVIGSGSPSGQYGYSYERPGYAFTGYFQTPIEVWDIVNNRQVNFAFVEWNDPAGRFDSTWAPDGSSVGAREYLLILKSDYDGDGEANAGTGAIDYTTEDFGDGGTFDFIYAGWFRLRGTGGYIDAGDAFQFIWANPADDNDSWTISTSAAATGNTTLAAEQLENVRVVPNPYYANSIYEADQFNREVRFLGVPEDFTIRIFNLAGDKVRTLSSDDPLVKQSGQSWAVWNLGTDNGLNIAAGVYIWYLESPQYGTTYGKMSVFPEVEQLNTY